MVKEKVEEMKKIVPNKKQKEAIETIDGTVMVLAGPGTGKTFTVIERIKYMLSKGISPEKILCMTFSEAAASEMQVRLQKEVGEDACSLKISTYHSFCMDIIKNYPNKFNLKDGFELIDEIKQDEIMRDIVALYKPSYAKTRLGDVFGDIEGLIKSVGKIKKSLISKEDYEKIIENGFAWEKELKRLEENRDNAIKKNRGTKTVESKILAIKNKFEKAKEIWEIKELYNKEIHQKNLIDFDDMIVVVIEQFKKDHEFLSEVSSNWDYIFVDEYQDTNRAQNNLVFALEQGRGLGNLFVVGDDDQLIYAFQGAEADTMETFLKLYPDTKVICLNENNRSTQTILDYSYEVINQDDYRLENNKEFLSKGISKKLTAANKDIVKLDRKIQQHQFVNNIQENNFVIEQIESIINSDKMPINNNGEPDFSKIAILTSSNSELEPFAELLKAKNIQYQIRSKKNIFEIRSSILAYFYLKAMENNKLYMDKLFGLLRHEPFNFNPEDFNYLLSKASMENKKDFITIIKENLNYKWQDAQKVLDFIKTYDELSGIKNSLTIKETLLAIINKTKILPYFLTSPINRFENIMGLKKLIEQAENFSKYKKTYSISDFARYLDRAYNNGIKIETDEDLFTKNAVQLSTIHSSKGREYDYVFLVNLVSSNWESSSKGCSDDFSLPIKDYSDDYGDLDTLKKELKRSEQLKKLFVAITRAKYALYLTFSTNSGKKTQAVTQRLASIERDDLVEKITHTLDCEQNIFEIAKSMSQDDFDYEDFEKTEYKGRLKDFVLSASSMNTYLKCPKQFFYSNVYKMKVQDTNTIQSSYGSLFHKVMEWFYDKKIHTSHPSYEETENKFKEFLNNTSFPSQEEREAILKRGVENLQTFYPKMLLTPLEAIVSTEEFVESELDGNKIKGYIDRVEKLDDGTYCICDYKTGDGESKKSKIKEGGEYESYYNQLRFYKVLYELKYPECTVSTLKIIFPETQTIADFQFTKDEMDDIKEKIKFVYDGIDNLEFNCPDEQNRACKYCDYKQTCILENI